MIMFIVCLCNLKDDMSILFERKACLKGQIDVLWLILKSLNHQSFSLVL